MGLADSLLADFDAEMAATRRLLERLPDDAFAWKPHERSFSLGELATHLAMVLRWGQSILNHDFYDLEAGGDRPAASASPDAVLSQFDQQVEAIRRSLVGRVDGELLAPWELRQGKLTLMSLPRMAALRRFVLHHLIHHRGQLTVYLRLRDVHLPPLYGPTADERM